MNKVLRDETMGAMCCYIVSFSKRRVASSFCMGNLIVKVSTLKRSL